MFWDIVILAGAFWVLMSFFTFMQTVQVNNIYKMLETSGKVYSGMDAGFLRTKYIAFAAVNSEGMILDARMLKASRIVTLPKTQPLDDLIDKNITSLNVASMNLEKRKALAVSNLSANFIKRSGGGKK